MGEAIGRRNFLAYGLAALSPLDILAQDEPKKKITLEQHIANLEEKLAKNHDDKLQQELGTTYYLVARREWYEVQKPKQDTPERYKAIRTNAKKALDITKSGATFDGIDERISICNLLIGVSYVREGRESAKGLPHLRQSVLWAETEEGKAPACSAIVLHYANSGKLQNVLKEFGKFYIKEPLMEQIYQHSRTQVKKFQVSVDGDDDLAKMVLLHRKIAFYAVDKEKAKPREKRDALLAIDHLFLAHTVGFYSSKDKPQVVTDLISSYNSIRKEFDNLPLLAEQYAVWNKLQHKRGNKKANGDGVLKEIKSRK